MIAPPRILELLKWDVKYILKSDYDTLQAHVADLKEAVTLLWMTANRADWDSKAIEFFDALIKEPT